MSKRKSQVDPSHPSTTGLTRRYMANRLVRHALANDDAASLVQAARNFYEGWYLHLPSTSLRAEYDDVFGG